MNFESQETRQILHGKIFFPPIFAAFSEYLNFKLQEIHQILPGGIFFYQFLRPSRNISTLNRSKFNKFFPGNFFSPILVAFSEYLNFKSQI